MFVDSPVCGEGTTILQTEEHPDPEWLEQYRGQWLPGSTNIAQVFIQAHHAPLRAFVAGLTGEPAGDLDALVSHARLRQSGEIILCKACGCSLSQGGSGHTSDCWLIAAVDVVLSGAPTLEIEQLEAEKSRQQKRLTTINNRLSLIRRNRTNNDNV